MKTFKQSRANGGSICQINNRIAHETYNPKTAHFMLYHVRRQRLYIVITPSLSIKLFHRRLIH